MSLITVNYFNIIKDVDEFLEIQSINTGHYWIIKKLPYFSFKLHIQVYHKHSLKNPYYHKHSQHFNIEQAIHQIKEHDKYILINQ